MGLQSQEIKGWIKSLYILPISELTLWQEAAASHAGNVISRPADVGKAPQKSARHRAGPQALPFKPNQLRMKAAIPLLVLIPHRLQKSRGLPRAQETPAQISVAVPIRLKTPGWATEERRQRQREGESCTEMSVSAQRSQPWKVLCRVSEVYNSCLANSITQDHDRKEH